MNPLIAINDIEKRAGNERSLAFTQSPLDIATNQTYAENIQMHEIM